MVMVRNSFLGEVKVEKMTIFDSHLVLLIIPFLVLLLVIKLKPFSWSKTKRLVWIRCSVLVLISAIITTFVESTNFDDFDQFFRGFNLFSNVDMLAIIALAVSLATKKFKLSRALVPVVIVFGAMNLINNPNAMLSWVQIITDLSGMSIALCLLPVMRKSINLGTQVVVLLVTAVVVGYVFVLNDFSWTSFTTFNISNIQENPFYHWMPDKHVVILMYLLALLFSEMFVWLIIKFVFHHFVYKNQTNFWRYLGNERITTTNQVSKELSNLNDFSLLNNSIFITEELIDKETDTDSKDIQIELVEDVKAVNEITDVIPLQIVYINNVRGIRAPSF